MVEHNILAQALHVIEESEAGNDVALRRVEEAWAKFLREIRDLPELQGTLDQMGNQAGFLNKSLCLRSLLKERSAPGWWNHSAQQHIATWLLDGTLNSAEESEQELDDLELEIEEMFSLARYTRIQNEVATILAHQI